MNQDGRPRTDFAAEAGHTGAPLNSARVKIRASSWYLSKIASRASVEILSTARGRSRSLRLVKIRTDQPKPRNAHSLSRREYSPDRLSPSLLQPFPCWSDLDISEASPCPVEVIELFISVKGQQMTVASGDPPCDQGCTCDTGRISRESESQALHRVILPTPIEHLLHHIRKSVDRTFGEGLEISGQVHLEIGP